MKYRIEFTSGYGQGTMAVDADSLDTSGDVITFKDASDNILLAVPRAGVLAILTADVRMQYQGDIGYTADV